MILSSKRGRGGGRRGGAAAGTAPALVVAFLALQVFVVSSAASAAAAPSSAPAPPSLARDRRRPAASSSDESASTPRRRRPASSSLPGCAFAGPPGPTAVLPPPPPLPPSFAWGGVRSRSAVLPRPPSTSSSSSSSSALGAFNFGGKTSQPEAAPTLPRDVKDAVSKCRQSVQDALGKRLSRMDVEFPVGTKFGVEKDAAAKKKGGRMAGALEDDDSSGAPTRDQLDKSDRELARLFVDMFQPVGGENIAVVFKDEDLADAARRRWKGDSTASCRILSVDRGRKKSKRGGGMGGGAGKKKGGARSKKRGFAAKMAAELEDDGSGSPSGGPFALPPNTEVALVVAPGPKELVAVERVCSDVGMGTLVVLLNARLSRVSNFGTEKARELFLEEFEPVFHLGAAPQEDAPGCLLHRSYPGGWVLARKPKVGPPKTILVTEERPTEEECADTYQSVEIGDVEKGVENVLENVAGWFK